MDYTNDPEYKAGMAEYQAATIVADKANDELSKLRAELAWNKREQEIRRRVETQAAAQQKLDETIALVKDKFPLIPASLYEHIKDPDTLLKVATEIGEKMESQVRSNTNSWGNASAPAGAGSGKRGAKKTQDDRYMQDLVTRVNKNEGGRDGAVKEYKDLIWKERVTPWREAGQK